MAWGWALLLVVEVVLVVAELLMELGPPQTRPRRRFPRRC